MKLAFHSQTNKFHTQAAARTFGVKPLPLPDLKADAALFIGIQPGLKPMVDVYKANNIPVIAYWNGSDVPVALTDAWYHAQNPMFDHHFCVSKPLKTELLGLSIKAHVIPPCPRGVFPDTPIEETRIAVYCPYETVEANRVYLMKETLEIIEANPETSFVLYGSSNLGFPVPSNVKHIGRFHPDASSVLFSNCSSILRLTKHDGFPQSCIEAKMRGRHVIINHEFPGMALAENLSEVNTLLKDPMIHQMDTGDFPRWYRENMGPEAFKQRLTRLINEEVL